MSRIAILKKIADYEIIIIKSGVVIDEELISRSKKLLVVGRAGTGTDNIDIQMLKKKKIKLMHCPGLNAIATSEFIICMILYLIKDIDKINQSITNNNFSRHIFQIRQLDSMNVGIIGLGKVGINLVKRLSTFNAKIFGYDISNKSKDNLKSFGVRFTSNIDQILTKSNIIVLCASLSEKSKNIINKNNYKLIRRGSYLINCARSNLMDQNIILKALEENILKSIAIDLIYPEPLYKDKKQKFHDLFYHPNVFYTPHIAAFTSETQSRISIILANKIKDYFKNKTF